MALLSRARLAVRESIDMAKLLTLPVDEREVVVYAEDSFTHIQLGGYLDALWAEHGIGYQYVTSDPEDPLLDSPPPGAQVWYIRNQLGRALSGLTCGVFFTTMPDLGKFHVPRPKAGKTVYAFHSLNSTHTAYRTGAFDGYDVLFCTGPHHVEELTRSRAPAVPSLPEVGYHKLDLIRKEHRRWRAAGAVEKDTVLLAPSWGRQNLLEAHGVEIVEALLAEGFRVIVRPHPQFFHSLYPKGAEVVESLRRRFKRNNAVEFELSIDTQDSFHRSSLMISDWSGAAYEYALGTLRPVLFVDTPQKIFNPEWTTLGLPSFEESMRSVVGRIIPGPQVAQIGVISAEMIGLSESRRAEFEVIARSIVFNLGDAATVGARELASVAAGFGNER